MLRTLKYTLIADALDMAVRHTPLFQGADGPPDLINFAGGGDYRKVGDFTANMVRDQAGLAPGDAILDIGCAIGRNALGLHRLYGDSLDYAGFDIVRYGISWCRRWARGQAPGWRFDHADIANSFYNPRGKIAAEAFRFPYPDAAFDVTLATSVYTHMQPGAVYHYLRESARVTRPGGRLLATVFALDADASAAIAAGRTAFTFAHDYKGAAVESAAEPDLAVGLAPDRLEAVLTKAGAREVAIRTGRWRGRRGVDFQDLLLARF
ncbi:MAG: class I SAM-dependent methyltransferase [Oceanicaulis sp.]